ncbi:hypothetical protein AAFF_G00266400, partial [Aldrovandia affinis]
PYTWPLLRRTGIVHCCANGHLDNQFRFTVGPILVSIVLSAMAWTPTAVILFCVWTFIECTETQVVCTFSEDCVLQCSFKAAGEEVIQWTFTHKEDPVHTYYHDADHLEHQDQRFKGRTSLFNDLIRAGNASLRLRNSNIQDIGRYHCYISNNNGEQNSWVNVEVHAPIQSVGIEMMGDEVNCSSQGIYPAPRVSWITDPPTQSDMLKDSTQTSADPRGLYSVQSRVRILDNISDHTYVCSVTSADGTQEWTTSLRQQEINSVNDGSAIIPCIALRTFNLHNFTLTWTFIRANKSEVILTFDSLTKQTVGHGTSQAKVDPDQVLSGNGSLWLQNTAQAGTYTCSFSAFQIQHLVHTHVKLTPARKKESGGNRSRLGVILAVIAVLVLLIAGMMIMYARRR